MDVKSPEQGQETDLQSKLINWAAAHPERYPSLVLLDPNNPDITLSENTGLAQQPETAHIIGSPLDAKVLETIVTDIDGRFPDMIKSLEQKEEETGFLTKIGERLESGKNIIVVANHENMGNLGFVLGAYICALKKKGYEFRTGTIVGKAAPYIGRKVGENVMSLMDVLSYGCDDIYIGYPDTDSTRESGIPDEVAHAQNKRMLKPLLKNLRTGGNFMVIDPTGKTNRVINGLVMFGKIGDATGKILSRDDTEVALAEIWLEDGADVFTTNGEIYTVRDKEKAVGYNAPTTVTVDELMAIHAAMLNKAVSPSIAVFETATQAMLRNAGKAATNLLLSSNQ
jgi:hypothetical protein